MVPTTKQADGISFWHVNVPPALRTTACPDFLLGLSDKDRTIIGTPDALYHPQTWEEVVSLVHANRLELFRRRPSDLRRYREFVHQVANQYGSVERFLLDTRLHWAAPLEPVGPAFESPEDIKLLRNDWPYGLDPKIVHLVVWTKFHLQEDPATEDLTNQARQQIEDFVERTFRSMMPKDTVRLASSPFVFSPLVYECDY